MLSVVPLSFRSEASLHTPESNPEGVRVRSEDPSTLSHKSWTALLRLLSDVMVISMYRGSRGMDSHNFIKLYSTPTANVVEAQQVCISVRSILFRHLHHDAKGRRLIT